MTKILVTGGTGFVGTNLCKYLLDKKHEVVALDDFSSSPRSNLYSLAGKKGFSFFEHDILKPLTGDVEKYIGPVEQIYNLACPASPPRYQKDPIRTHKISTIGIHNVVELALKNNARLLQASTSEVYGDPEVHPQREDYWGKVNPIGKRSCYDEGKRSAECLLMDYHNDLRTKLDVRIIRIFNTYGPNMDPKDGRVVSQLIMQALKGENLTIYGDGTQTRSFQYISDLLEGMHAMMNNDQGFVGPVNIGNPYEFTMLELAEKIKNKTCSKSKIIHMPLPSDDPKKRRPDIKLATEKLGWSPTVTLDEGLDPTIDYFKKYAKISLESK